MSSIDSMDGLPTPAGVPRKSLADGDRYRWEQQWLEQNRNVSGVVAPSDAIEFSTEVGAQSLPGVQALLQEKTVSTPSIAPANSSQHADVDTGSDDKHYYGGINSKAVFFSVSLIDVVTEPAPLRALPEESLILERQALSLYSKSQPPSIALWRDGENVSVALRLHEPEREAADTFNTLRQWLEESGLRLMKMIVNGRSYWARTAKKYVGF